MPNSETAYISKETPHTKAPKTMDTKPMPYPKSRKPDNVKTQIGERTMTKSY